MLLLLTVVTLRKKKASLSKNDEKCILLPKYYLPLKWAVDYLVPTSLLYCVVCQNPGISLKTISDIFDVEEEFMLKKLFILSAETGMNTLNIKKIISCNVIML
jgi:hypothetical protein